MKKTICLLIIASASFNCFAETIIPTSMVKSKVTIESVMDTSFPFMYIADSSILTLKSDIVTTNSQKYFQEGKIVTEEDLNNKPFCSLISGTATTRFIKGDIEFDNSSQRRSASFAPRELFKMSYKINSSIMRCYSKTTETSLSISEVQIAFGNYVTFNVDGDLSRINIPFEVNNPGVTIVEDALEFLEENPGFEVSKNINFPANQKIIYIQNGKVLYENQKDQLTENAFCSIEANTSGSLRTIDSEYVLNVNYASSYTVSNSFKFRRKIRTTIDGDISKVTCYTPRKRNTLKTSELLDTLKGVLELK